MARNNNRNISRIESGATQGFQVRITRQGRQWCKLFSDSVWGGQRKALKAAREYREELLEDLSHLVPTRREICDKNRGRSSTRIAGVRLVRETDASALKGYYEYYLAEWCPEPGVRRKRQFSVLKYGKRKAKQLAVAARKAGVAAITD